MYIKFSANTSAASGLVQYLSKEDTLLQNQVQSMEKDVALRDYVEGYVKYLSKEDTLGQKEFFFNDKSTLIEGEEAAMRISGNCKGLKRNEAHFYMITISPSEKELQHLQNIAGLQARMLHPKASEQDVVVLRNSLFRDLLKQHTVEVMNQYAQHFGREGINSASDLVWYGKVEKDRYWKHDSPEVKHNRKILSQIRKLERQGGKASEIKALKTKLIYEFQVRPGGAKMPIYEKMPKSGLNYHVHVMVSRKDVSQKVSLSPMAKQKASKNHQINGVGCKVGFDRDAFAQKVEKAFDTKFQYRRQFSETYEGKKLIKNNPQKYREARLKYNREHGIGVRAQKHSGIGKMTTNFVAKTLLSQSGVKTSKIALVMKLVQSGQVRADSRQNPGLGQKMIQNQIAKQISRQLVRGAVQGVLGNVGLSIPGINVAVAVVRGAAMIAKQGASQGREEEHER